jgi:hypothetical protein
LKVLQCTQRAYLLQSTNTAPATSTFWTTRTINGHLDSIGSASYNQKLSAACRERRVGNRRTGNSRQQTADRRRRRNPKGDNATLQGAGSSSACGAESYRSITIRLVVIETLVGSECLDLNHTRNSFIFVSLLILKFSTVATAEIRRTSESRRRSRRPDSVGSEKSSSRLSCSNFSRVSRHAAPS